MVLEFVNDYKPEKVELSKMGVNDAREVLIELAGFIEGLQVTHDVQELEYLKLKIVSAVVALTPER